MKKIPKDLHQNVIAKAKQAGASEAEVFITSVASESIEVLNQKIEAIDIKEEIGLGLRVFKSKRLGFAFTTALSSEHIDDLIKKAVESSGFSVADEFNSLPSPKPQPLKMDIYDDTIARTPLERKVEYALAIEKAAYSLDQRVKKTEKSVYHDGETETRIANSKGLDVHFEQNYCGGHIEIIAEEGGLAENGQYGKFVRSLSDFDPKAIGLIAARKALELLNAGSMPSARLDLVMDPTVAAHFLEAAFPMFSADFVQKRKSLLSGKLGETIGSSVLTLLDSGIMPNGLGTAPFDNEGSPSRKTLLIDKGVLKGFLYDHYTAEKDKVSSTGNAGRAGFKSIPTVGPTNLYIEPGDVSGDDLLKGVSKGLYITRVMGMHTVNPISGDFSVGAAGILIKNGRKTAPVRGITIAGNLIEILKSIKAVGSDLVFEMNIGSPTLLIEGVTVSGQ